MKDSFLLYLKASWYKNKYRYHLPVPLFNILNAINILLTGFLKAKKSPFQCYYQSVFLCSLGIKAETALESNHIPVQYSLDDDPKEWTN
jgi:hypothetical protein